MCVARLGIGSLHVPVVCESVCCTPSSCVAFILCERSVRNHASRFHDCSARSIVCGRNKRENEEGKEMGKKGKTEQRKGKEKGVGGKEEQAEGREREGTEKE